MTQRKGKRVQKRDRQRIAAIRARHGDNAFSRFGKQGGRGHRKPK